MVIKCLIKGTCNFTLEELKGKQLLNNQNCNKTTINNYKYDFTSPKMSYIFRETYSFECINDEVQS